MSLQSDGLEDLTLRSNNNGGLFLTFPDFLKEDFFKQKKKSMCLNPASRRDNQNPFIKYYGHLFPYSKRHIHIIMI